MLLVSILKEKYKSYILKRTLSNYIRHFRVSKRIKSLIPLTLLNVKLKGDDRNVISSDSPIFVFWWQGEENLPLIPKICIERIKKMSGEHPVHFICKDNIREYSSTIPESVYNLLEQGIITVQYFSDILRTDLLYNRGGIWLDATIWPCRSIDDIVSVNPRFYTGRRCISDVGNACVSRGRWTGYFLSSPANNSLIKFVHDGLIEAAVNYNGVIDYLTIDYLFDIAYKRSTYVRDLINSIPATPNVFWMLLPFLGEVVSKDFFESILQQSLFYKLNWRINCELKVDGCNTLLGYMSE